MIIHVQECAAVEGQFKVMWRSVKAQYARKFKLAVSIYIHIFLSKCFIPKFFDQSPNIGALEVFRLKVKKTWPFMVFLSSLSLVLSSCATMSDSLILGIGAGAAAGSVVSNQNHGDAGTGAAIGAAIGGLSAYLIHKGIEKREVKIRRETLLNLEKFDVSTPPKSGGMVSIPTGGGHFLTKPVVDMEWIETQVQGDKLVEGHRVWRIIEKPKWIPSDDQDKVQKK